MAIKLKTNYKIKLCRYEPWSETTFKYNFKRASRVSYGLGTGS